MRDFYELTLGRKARQKATDFIYHLAPILKLLAIGLFSYALSLKGSLSYIIISISVSIFLFSVILNFVRQKMLFEYRYTYDKSKGCFFIEKAYLKLKPEIIAKLSLSDIVIDKSANQNYAYYFEGNDLQYVISVGDGNNNYTIAVDTYMYALLSLEKI